MGEKPKIAIVANSTWNIYNFRLSLIKTLKSAGFRVIVIAPVDEYIHYLSDSYFTKHVPLRRMNPQGRNPVKDLLLFWELYRIYKREKPDLVLHFTVKPNIYGSLAATVAGIKSVSTVTGLGYAFLNSNFKNKLVRPLYRFAMRKLPKVLFHNQDDIEQFIKERLVRREQTMLIGGSGVDMGYYKQGPRQGSERFIFLFAGRLLRDKGIIEFVSAARQLLRLAKRAECWVVGELKSANPSAVSKYEVLGWVSEKAIRYYGHAKDIRKYMSQADVFVLPSYREGLPRAVLEAMSMGKPIITTDVPGCRETVEEGKNGYLVTVKDSDSLAEAMMRMYKLSDPELEEMGANSVRLCQERFDVRIINLRYLELIRSLLDPEYNAEAVSSKSRTIL